MARPAQFDRNEAVAGAIRVFARHGYEAASTSDLLASMGIGRQSLYGAFGYKRRLFLEELRRYASTSYEEIRDATFVKAGEGLTIERRGTRAGHQYQLLGHTTHGSVMVEPYLITLRHESDVFPTFQHAGMEFLYMLEGNVLYRHGEKTYDMHPGDALFFDAEAPHGPEEMRKLPARFLSIISYRRDE